MASHRDEYNIYNTRCALAVTTGQNEAKTSHVLNLHMAPKKGNGNTYEWTQGIRVQLTESEICDFIACLTNKISELKAIRSTSKGTNYFNVQKDSRGVVSLSMRSSHVAASAMIVKLSNPDKVKLSVFAFRCFMRNNGGVSQEVLYQIQNKIYSN